MSAEKSTAFRLSSIPHLKSELIALCKPRVVELLITTALPAMFLAARGIPDALPVIGVLVGGTLAAGSANAINSIIEKETDSKMFRTSHRPMPQDKIPPKTAWTFAITTQIVALVFIALLANIVASFYTLLATIIYVFVYTIWLKPRSDQNIVIGGAAGALPAVIGYSAVVGYAPWQAWILFTVIFMWTPAHFWALAIFHEKDYRLGNFPMLPVTKGVKATNKWILIYSVLTVIFSFVMLLDPDLFLIYGLSATLAGAWFIYEAMVLLIKYEELHRARYMRFFHVSNGYLALLFIALAFDAVF